MANQMDTLNITSRMIKHALSSKIVESWLFRFKLKTNQRERFTWDHSNKWICSECFCRIL